MKKLIVIAVIVLLSCNDQYHDANGNLKVVTVDTINEDYKIIQPVFDIAEHCTTREQVLAIKFLGNNRDSFNAHLAKSFAFIEMMDSIRKIQFQK